MRTLSHAGLEHIARFEGFRVAAYQDSGGVWTIGFGHTGGVRPGQTVTRAQALRMLSDDAHGAAEAIRDALRHMNTKVNQGEFDALVSLAYNAGSFAVIKSAWFNGMTRHHRPWSRFRVGLAIAGWYVHDAQGHRLLGLVRRRAAERRIFRCAASGWRGKKCGHRLPIQ